jgi:ethanolamine utilization protein EutQ (cupin superfamily)
MIPDFDEKVILKSLRPGEECSVLCEGCELVGIRKDSLGQVFYGYYKNKTVEWTLQYDDLI